MNRDYLLVLMVQVACLTWSICRTAEAVEPQVLTTLNVEEELDSLELHRSIKFDPPTIDFGSWSVGTAHSTLVTLVNQNSNRSVYLNSVSGRTPAFYSSFFESKEVAPRGNTTFNVVFLPREHGSIAADLLIHTSFGRARLKVRGEGRECPYRLKPLVGIKAPLNAILGPEIHMYNPHGRALQILEVYSSGGQFQLELPSGGHEGPQTLWEIPPYATKPVIRIHFHGQTAGNYTAYIRIKISEPPARDDGVTDGTVSENMLVVPVEFEIMPQYGIYAENPLLDFGRVATDTEVPVKLQLQLRNSYEKESYEMTDIDYVQQGQESRGLTFAATDATVSLDAQLFAVTQQLNHVMLMSVNLKQQNTKISIQQNFTVVVRADIFKGTLAYDRNTTIFVSQSSDFIMGEKRRFVVYNNFESPLALLNVHLDANEQTNHLLDIRLGIALGENGHVLSVGESLELLQLRVLNDSPISTEEVEHLEHFHSRLRIVTNVTDFDVPIIICSGHLHVSTYDSNTLLLQANYTVELNVGSVPLAELPNNGFIVLRNHLPLTIKLNTWDFQSAPGVYFHTLFLGCLRQSALRALRNALSIQIDSAKFKLCSEMQENDVAVFQVAIQSYTTEHDQHTGALNIWTPYEQITAVVRFSTWTGKLDVEQDRFYFKDCFPGKHCTADLAIRSTFKHPVQLISIQFDEVAFRFESFNTSGSSILPGTVTNVGRVHFLPAELCKNTRCYIPQDDKTRLMAFPPPEKTNGGPNNNLHFDETELRRRTELFRQLKSQYKSINLTLKSREIGQLQLPLNINIEWPKLVADGAQTLPTIEVGSVHESTVVITNPADSAILIDYYISNPMYAKETQLSLPLEVIEISSNCYLTDKAVFTLPAGSTQQPVLLPPHASISLRVRFIAEEADSFCTLLHIRNNFTLYEGVWLSAKAVQSQFRFGNRKPGSTTPLLFDVSAQQLVAVCAAQQQLVVHRSFTARNNGEIPLRIDGFLIGGQQCEGFGFKVLECAFELGANTSKKIEIAFRPDFTVTRVSRPLTLRTNLSYDVKYLLLAQLPLNHLEKCAELQPRPVWEQRMRNAAIVLLATTFVFVLIAAHVDYGNILVSQSVLYAAREKGPVHHFNLRSINMSSKTRIPYFEDDSTGMKSRTTALSAPAASAINQAAQKSASSCPNNNYLKKRILKSKNQQPNSQRTTNLLPARLTTLDWSLQFSTNIKEVPVAPIPSKPTTTAKAKQEVDKSVSLSASIIGEGNSNSSLKPTMHSNQLLKSAVHNISSPSGAVSVGKKQHRGCKKLKAEKTKLFAKSDKAIVACGVDAKDIAMTTSIGLAGRPKPIETQFTGEAFKPTNPTLRTKGSTPMAKERRVKDVVVVSTQPMANGPLFSFAASSTSSSASSSSSSLSTHSKRIDRKKQKVKPLPLPLPLPMQSYTPVAARRQPKSAVLSSDACVVTAPWETSNQISFSRVLQQSENITGLSMQGQFKDSSQMATSVVIATELGPIGSKKSPCSTPAIWESIVPESLVTPATIASSNPVNLAQQATMPNNPSFFSHALPNAHAEAACLPQLMDAPTAQTSTLYEVEYLLNLQQQQLQQQRQHHHQAQQLQLLQNHDNVNDNVNWGALNAAWSPMGYSVTAPTATDCEASGSHHMFNGGMQSLGSWQNSLLNGINNNMNNSTPLRPPPGLEGTSFHHQLPQHHQQMPLAGSSAPSVQEQNMLDLQQAYDPFSSLSSIWNDNWNKRQQQNKEHHHMN